MLVDQFGVVLFVEERGVKFGKEAFTIGSGHGSSFSGG